jgi:tetratricopeptide (TPR) repeat protein
MARRVLDVFLSSTALDLAEYRKAVHERLMRTQLFVCVRQEDFGAQNAGAVEFCRRKAQEADLYVGLIGLRRGWEPDGDNEKRSITEMEHDWARDAGRPRYLWVAPENFAVPGNLRESDELHTRQTAFRKRVMGGGERIVSQKGFGSPELLASEIVEQLLTQVVASDLLKLIRPEAAPPGQPTPSKEEQAPAIAAAVGRLAEDKDVDLMALAKNPKGLDVAELEAKLMARERELEEEAGRTAKKRAEYWRHIGALAFLSDTQKALTAYKKATALDPDNPDGWRYLGELHYRLGNLSDAREIFDALRTIGARSSNAKAQSVAFVRLSWIEQLVGNVAGALQLGQKGLKLSEAEGWQEGMARSYDNLCAIYYTKGDLDRAEDMQLKALKLNEELGRKEGMAIAYRNLAAIYWHRNDKAKICDYLGRERDLWRAMGLEDNAAEAENWMRLEGCGED